MIEQDDWRLHFGNKPDFYASLTWSFKKWTQTRPHWDHDHCEFCQIKLSDSEIDEVMHEGWTDNDEYGRASVAASRCSRTAGRVCRAATRNVGSHP